MRKSAGKEWIVKLDANSTLDQIRGIENALFARQAMGVFRMGDRLSDEQVKVLMKRFKAIFESASGLSDYELARRVAIQDYNNLRDVARHRGFLSEFED